MDAPRWDVSWTNGLAEAVLDDDWPTGGATDMQLKYVRPGVVAGDVKAVFRPGDRSEIQVRPKNALLVEQRSGEVVTVSPRSDDGAPSPHDPAVSWRKPGKNRLIAQRRAREDLARGGDKDSSLVGKVAQGRLPGIAPVCRKGDGHL